jgi:hypothetical protein
VTDQQCLIGGVDKVVNIAQIAEEPVLGGCRDEIDRVA